MNLNAWTSRARRTGPTVVAVLALGFPAVASAAEPDGKALYLKHCASCHGKDGKAKTPAARKLGVKDLTISRTTDAEIERRIREGRKDEKGNQRMPPFADKLKDDEIVAVLGVVNALRASKE